VRQQIENRLENDLKNDLYAAENRP